MARPARLPLIAATVACALALAALGGARAKAAEGRADAPGVSASSPSTLPVTTSTAPTGEPSSIPAAPAEASPPEANVETPAGAAALVLPPLPRHETDLAIARAVRCIQGRIGPDGRCVEECQGNDSRFGVATAVCVHALLVAGVDPKEPVTVRAIQWLEGAKLEGTCALAMRACALAAIKGPRRPQLDQDVRWLLAAADAAGGYSYASLGGKPPGVFDNANAQAAVTGVWAGAARGVPVPAAYWEKVRKYWASQQQGDGGWGYVDRDGTKRAGTYGSITAAGLAAMYICVDAVSREEALGGDSSGEDKTVSDGLDWIGRRFSATENPGRGPEWYYYWLDALGRAAMASGRKHLGGHDWDAECVRHLLASQNDDGSWGEGAQASDTAMAVLFLARARGPVLVSKLRYAGKWNPRPRDAANLARYLSETYERPVSWQVLDVDAPAADWQDSPILYISGAGPVEFTDAQIEKLRTFVGRGGMLLCEAAANNADFTLDMQKVYKRLFPDYPLQRLGDDHPVYSLLFAPKEHAALAGVSNGVRLLAIHSAGEMSLAMQLGPSPERKPVFDLLANVYMVATDKGHLRPRGQGLWPAAQAFEPAATIRVARLRHAGNCDPEPLAWPRLAVLISNRQRVKLEVSGPMEIAKLDAAQWPIAHMTGTADFTLAAPEAEALKKYVASGGTLVIDAAGGSRPFAAAVEKQVLPLFEGRPGPLASAHPIYKGPETLKTAYRRDYAFALGSDRDRPRLQGVEVNGRTAVVYSGEDLTAGLVGYSSYGIRGYAPDTAVSLMINILMNAGR